MTPFELAEPASLREALALLDPDDSTVRPIAGGTALMLMMKAGVFRPTRLVSLRKLDAQYARIVAGADGTLTIGAMTPLAKVERSPEVARVAPVIPRAMRRLSNIRVRNVATIGGNLAHGDPHMDLPPVLIALGAEVAIGSPTGERTIAVEDLFAGYFETVLAKNELITELRIPAQGKSRAAYMKVTTGSAEDWPALGVAVALVADGPTVKSARVVVSAATEKAIRLKSVENVLAGATVDDVCLARAGDAAAEEAECISDVRGSAAYKRELLRVYVGRVVRQALGEQARNSHRSRGWWPTPPYRAADATHHHAGRRASRARRRSGRALAAAARGAREGHGASRIHPHHAASRHAARQDFPQHGRAWPHQIDRPQGGQGGARRLSRRYVGGRAQGHPGALLRAGIPRSADPGDRQGALCRRAGCRGAFRRSPCRRGGGATDRRRIRGAAGDLRRGRGRREQDPGTPGAQARRHLRRSKAPQGPQGHQYRARFQAQARRCRQGLRRGRPGLRAHLPHAEGAASRARAVRVDRRLERDGPDDLQRLAGSFLRAHRNRPAARLAGEPRPHQGALSRRRLRRQALYQARSAGDRALHDRTEPGQGRAHHGRAVLHHHQASQHVPHQDRRRQERPHHRPQVRGVLERWRLRRYRAARDAEIGLHRFRPLRHRQCLDRFLRALHQCASGGSAARLWHSPTGVGL